MRYFIATILLLVFTIVRADVTVPMYSTDAKHTFLGNITFKNSQYGLMILPNLKGLTPGMHGFHIHEKPFCDDKAMASGGHWDPAKTGKHLGPYDNNGHLGDLPALFVNQDGNAVMPILAPRLRADMIAHHALIIHEDGDNYSDQPKPLGGGGARVACGIISTN